ncbi:hypothetical protein BC835DRAFT_139959 [Cytidiella melzeri]|nr:hypothetical protein BC835DRAFT_139959 [Cytidiella melzeri]
MPSITSQLNSLRSFVMAPITKFEVDLGKMEAALAYVVECFEWLAAEDSNLGCVAHDLDFDKVKQATSKLVHSVNRVQNRLAPINRLPPELLGGIFEHLIDAYPSANWEFEFMDYPWPNVQSVCHYWRHVAVHTPVLWSYIYASHDQALEVFERQRACFSTSLSRSGAVPLTIFLQGTSQEGPGKNVFDLLSSNFERILELRVRYCPTDFLEKIAENCASQLEVLVVDSSGLADLESFGMPKLRTFVARTIGTWVPAALHISHALRHLVVEGLWYADSGTFHGLHALLASNPQLEDLVLHNICDVGELRRVWDELPSLSMPRLRRLSVQYNDQASDSIAHELFDKKLILQEGYAKSYNLKNSHRFSPLRKLFLADIFYIVTTDGHTSLRVSSEFAVHPLHTTLDELWLWPRSRAIRSADALWLEEAKEVKKVVLFRGITSWLEFFSRHRLFPALAELQLHSQEHQDEPAILGFLETRARENPIQTLRFVPDPSSGGKTEALSSWKDTITKFTQFVPHVIFEDPDRPPLRMELPAICTTDSTVHPYWPSWEHDMYEFS